MKLLHTTIVRSQKILNVLPLFSPDPTIANALLLFRNYVQRIQIDNSGSKISASSVCCYPLSSPLVWCGQFGKRFLAITHDAHILFFEQEAPFKPVSCHQLTDKLSPSQLPIAHVSPSINHMFLVCAAFTKNCFVIQNSENTFTQMNVELPNFTVLKIAPTSTENIFALLVMDANGDRFIVFADMTSQNYSQVKEFQVPNDTYLILPANNGDSILYFTMSAIAIVDSENIISSPQISSYFMMDYNYLVYQTIEGNMYGLNTETFNCDSLGMIPLISKFTLLNRTTLFCVSEYSDSYIISIPEIIGDKINFKFEDLPRETLTFTPRTIRALFKDRKLIVAAGHASQSSITNITNSLQFHKETIANVDQSLLYSFQENNYNGSISSYSQMKLFCYHGDTIILSNPKETVIISGSANISSNPTFVIGRLGQNSINKKNSYIQIHTRGIKNIATGEEWESPDEVIAGCIGYDTCFVALKNEHCILLNSELKAIVEKNIGVVYYATYCEKSIAIATKVAGTEHSAIVIYDSKDLNPGDDEAGLLSAVFSMHFSISTMELYVSTLDGNVSKFEIAGSDFSNTRAVIYSSNITPSILTFADLILIVADRTFIYNGQQLLALTSTNSPPLAVTSFDNSLYILDQNGEIYLVSVEDFEHDLLIKTQATHSTPRRMISFDDFILVLLRTVNNNVTSSYIAVLNSKNEIIKTVPLDNNVGATIISRIPNTKSFIVGCTVNNGNNNIQNYLLFMKFLYDPNYSDFESSIRLEKVDKVDVPGCPHAISYFEGAIFVAAGRKILSIIKDQNNEFICGTLASLHTQASFLEIAGNFAWVGDGTQSICFFSISKNLENQAKGKNIFSMTVLAFDSEPKQITALCVLDNHRAAVGDKFGTITIFQLPDDIIANVHWRTSRPPDRGVYMPSSIGSFIKLASYNVGEAITSIIKAESSEALFFYTTLFGQIGAFIQIKDDDDYNNLSLSEHLSSHHWQKEFGMMKMKRFDHLNISVVGMDVIEFIEQLPDKAQKQIEDILKSSHNVSIQQIMGLIGKYKTMSKF